MLLSDQISNQVTQICIDHQIIEVKQEELYHYCFSYFFDVLLYNISILMFGFLLHRPLQAFLFTLITFPGKAIVGGAHASTPERCRILSYGIFLFSLWFLNTYSFSKLSAIILYSIACVILILLTPVDHPNKRFDTEQKHRLRIACCIFIIPMTVAFFITICFNKIIYYNLITLCVTILMCNQMIGILQNRRYLHEA